MADIIYMECTLVLMTRVQPEKLATMQFNKFTTGEHNYYKLVEEYGIQD